MLTQKKVDTIYAKWKPFPGSTITDAEDVKVLTKLVKRHRWYDDERQLFQISGNKDDGTAKYIDVQNATFFMNYSSKHPAIVAFHIADNISSAEFSKKIGRNTLSYINSRMRTIITPQINEYRAVHINNDRTITCAITGEKLPIKGIEVDHNFDVITFKELVNNWMEENGITYKHLDEIDAFVSADCPYSKSWKIYHKNHAVLRCIKTELNQQGRR